ncbi:MAG: AgmX/PglI C-terminal domain-containing protein [Kofleriaceae bacterium]|nr:AgmX/PglI C-terminal domain-containing protein [Kofleriaceae bacterium]
MAVNPNPLGQGPGSGVFAELASDADAGTGAGAGLGTIGASRHGTSAAGAHHVVVARLDRTAPASARIVVVADHGVTIGTLDRVLRGIDEPVALAVAGAGDAAAALPFTIVPGTAGAASGARELRLTLERPGAVTLSVDGQVYFVEPRPDATTDRAELDRGVAALAGAAPLSAFRLEARPERLLGPAVAALDAMAGGAAPGTLYVRVDRGSGGMRSGRIALPLTRFGNVTAEGELDRAIIRRYLRRAVPKLTYCYEQRLLTQPSLAGTVTTDLVIDGQGRVTSARSKGVDPSVERCVAAVVKAIEFPRPHAGIVRVSFPIEFQPTGG